MLRNRNSVNKISAEMKLKKMFAEDIAKSDMSSDTKKQSRKSRISKNDPVEPYRAYGVTRKEYHLYEKLKLFVARGVFLLVIGGLILIWALGAVTFLLYGNILLSTLVVGAVSLLVLMKFSKPIRRRLKFQKKLKKLCREKNYKLKFEQNFFDSLVWSPEKLDFTLNTGTHLYLVHYLTLPKYNARLTFLDGENFVYTKHRLRNPFTVIFDLKDKHKNYSVKFPKKYELDRKKTVRALIVNPVCRDIFRKNELGVIEAAGSGADIFGFSVYTGSGFIESVRRNEELNRNPINH